MNKPSRITFTGIDEECNVRDLVALSLQEPRLEFGVLVKGLTGAPNPRYPSRAWINQIVPQLKAKDITLALHVCGTEVSSLLSEGMVTGLDPAVFELFGRIQINGTIPAKLLTRFKDLVFASVGARAIITQYDANPLLYISTPGTQTHQFLFDSSGGTGILRDKWPAPVPGIACGYAGGLSAATLESAMPKIVQSVRNAPYWIDMESGLRGKADNFSIPIAFLTIAALHRLER